MTLIAHSWRVLLERMKITRTLKMMMKVKRTKKYQMGEKQRIIVKRKRGR